jgi:hypothetical protein
MIAPMSGLPIYSGSLPTTIEQWNALTQQQQQSVIQQMSSGMGMQNLQKQAVAQPAQAVAQPAQPAQAVAQPAQQVAQQTPQVNPLTVQQQSAKAQMQNQLTGYQRMIQQMSRVGARSNLFAGGNQQPITRR